MARVAVEQGALLGGQARTESGYQFYEFLKIPYARPPLGELRFKSPQPPEPWQGERDASSDDHTRSLVFDGAQQKLVGQEDSLYLNVYSPRLRDPRAEPLPVIVYIHGGGFLFGTAVPAEVEPDYLVEHGVVVVTVNYRLGALGFLCLDIPEAAGNMGLKDQVMALKWVQKNITQFGGDKNNITLFGISAGGVSVEYHCISELSRGLFHKAIPQSGSTLNHWAINFNIKDLSHKLAEALGCPAKDEKSILNFLLAAPASDLVGASLSVVGFPLSKPTYFGFVPTVEKDFGNGEAFITDYPYNIIKQKKSHDIPMMKGFCEFEGLMAHFFKPHLLEELMEKKNFVEYCNHPIDDPAYFQEKFHKTYFDDYVKKVEDMPTQSAVDFIGHVDFSGGVWRSAQLMASNSSPVYVYMFAYTSRFSIFDTLSNKEQQPAADAPLDKRGAGHGDDSIFVMKMKYLDTSKLSETDKLIIKRYSTLLSNFAKTGDPTPATSALTPLRAPAFRAPHWRYLRVDTQLTVEADYAPDKMELFKEMYEKYRR